MIPECPTRAFSTLPHQGRPAPFSTIRLPHRRVGGSNWVIVAGLLFLGPGIDAAEHPSLVDVAATRCTDCHDDLWTEKATLHPPVEEDCTTCHDFSDSDAGFQVELIAEGTALCLVCHDGFQAAVEAELETPHFPVTESCTTCHDPHASENERLLLAGVGELCALCHEPEDLAEPHGGQLTPLTDCRSCHNPHGSNNGHMLLGRKLHPPFAERSCNACHRQPFGDRVRLRNRGEKLCVSCHSDLTVPPRGDRAIHPAMWGEGGRAGCLSCHNPHMSDYSRLLVRPGNELCKGCHAAVVESASGEGGHAAAEDCLNCHQPHRSEEKPLLVEAKAEICLLCHDAKDEDFKTAHLGAELEGAKCVRCHTPHGSENGHLLAANLHPPVLDGCDLCHDGASDRFVEDPPDLCLMCHDDIGELAANAKVQHAALELGTCVDCHNPHASAQERLVKLPGGGACLECHDDIAPGKGETGHGIIDIVGCRACHEPHGGERAKLLRTEGSDLCLSCHGPGALPQDKDSTTARLLGRFDVPLEKLQNLVILQLSADGLRNHPVGGHRTLGEPTEQELAAIETTYAGGAFTCLTCHDPHKGRALLLRDAASPLEACLRCHPK